ncbi:MAG: hypothetical protein M3480_07040 [Verrucomicrobiota bacterium]|nr:hypothetical protein [Chthoniobacterales bacterium]MDQ3414711.1 hypothetical protein [Verrucomicrobiota bacterium]
MKAILGSLLCLVLVSSECFALKGGPPYPASTNIIGTYAGVLQPAFDPTDPFSANSLGVFTLGVPSTGASTGTFIMFTRGRIFGGTIQGVGDVNKATVSALLDASFNYTLTVIDDLGVPQSIEVTASVNGPLNAKVVPTRSPFAISSAKLKGDATVFISNGGVTGDGDPIIDGTLSLDVMGFKQSSAEPATGTIAPPTG